MGHQTATWLGVYYLPYTSTQDLTAITGVCKPSASRWPQGVYELPEGQPFCWTYVVYVGDQSVRAGCAHPQKMNTTQLTTVLRCRGSTLTPESQNRPR